MKEIRYWLAGICIWLFCFFSLERLNPDIQITSFVYVYAAAGAVLTILLPRLQRINQFGVIVVALLPYLILKRFLDYDMLGAQLPITVFEAAAIGLTLVIVGRIVYRLEVIQEIIADLTIGNLKEKTAPFETGQVRLYQEIRRARYFKHPATLLALSPTKESVRLSLDHFVQEAQQTIIYEYVSARVAQLLVDQLKDCDIITQNGNHFVVLLPETNYEDAMNIIEKLKVVVHKELNLDLRIGVSTFPDEAVTLESLVQSAEENMLSSMAQPADPAMVQGKAVRALDNSASYAGVLHVAPMTSNKNNNNSG